MKNESAEVIDGTINPPHSEQPMVEGITIGSNEFNEIFKNSPAVNVKDAVPEPIKPYSVSKEFGLDED